jgi:hypothetical protein
MKKQKMLYRFRRYEGQILHAKREIPYELKLTSRLVLDELCFNWNKAMIEAAIDRSLAKGNQKDFFEYSEAYNHYIWE